ncbi:cAMP-specific 3',5'-cAMP phosphodiesterase 4 [Thecamonas trahens ATCC 50062]|uniref:Phosphodiesterase n=1 Tax=Thecamonas trahens ATCC 50062 TaxID=461836 RepID=A0A0L0DP85_THETB|nr:cAMP-specific 3',5'-cAMP phosphodiesterase 4 [Thecamonas trahens ATCC 50062]KNC53238.1 cAMP-specific 3',5'-cAMP phosphodiesterase 4 [Thecamonas trahens ATCC 50062]|eukprot:XP_013754504.1 cAMP-specific 3',5'-cAMP phosphodiesterase 4 [Thecamonas trahens ATCC 50062]
MAKAPRPSPFSVVVELESLDTLYASPQAGAAAETGGPGASSSPSPGCASSAGFRHAAYASRSPPPLLDANEPPAMARMPAPPAGPSAVGEGAATRSLESSVQGKAAVLSDVDVIGAPPPLPPPPPTMVQKLQEMVTLFSWSPGGEVKANITLQMTVLYVLFVAILLSAEIFGWAPHIRFFNLVPLAFVSLVVLELSNVIATLFPDNSYHQYLHLLPLGIIVVIFREAHMVCAVIFFSASSIIFMQVGDERSSGVGRVGGYTLCCLIVYLSAVLFSSQFYTDVHGTSFTTGRVLSPPIHWGEEFTFCVCVALLGLALLATTRFVHLFARSVASHQEEVSMLRAELDSFTSHAVQVDTPISRVLALLTKVRDEARPIGADHLRASRAELAHRLAIVRQVNEALAILSAGALYQPEIRGGADTAVSSWVMETTEMTGHAANGYSTDGSETPSNATESGLPLTAPELWQVLVSFADDLDPVAASMPKLMDMLDSWTMDIFEFTELASGHPVVFMGMLLLHKNDAFANFRIDERKALRFLSTIESGYVASNPYHNAIHAADVAHAFHVWTTLGGVGYFLSSLEIFAGIIACLVHDFGHPGVNNNFLIAVSSPLAIRYNDSSVLESHHCAAAYTLLQDPALNILSNLTSKQRTSVRSVVTTMILATDMAKHFELLSKFNAQLTGLKAEAAAGSFDSNDSKALVLRLVVKCCDISNPAKPWHIASNWSGRVMEESFRQGDRERAAGMRVSTFMDRSAPVLEVYKAQVGFIEIFVRPLYEAVTALFPDMASACSHIDANHAMWEAKKNTAATEAALAASQT